MNFLKYISILTEDITLPPKRGGEYKLGGSKNEKIMQAIDEKKMISFMYRGPLKPNKDSVKPGKRQKVCPVAIGASKKGSMIVRCWIEPPNPSKRGFNKKTPKDIPFWRTFMVSRMYDIQVLDENYDIKKLTGYKQNSDKSMAVIYKSAKISGTPKIKTQPKPVSKAKPATKPTTPVKPQPEKKKEEPKKPEPIKKPEVKKPEPPKKPELPKKPETEKKPEPKPQQKPEKIEPKGKEEKKPADKTKESLPQVKPEKKPSKSPETKPDEEMEPLIGLSEQIKKIKSLMFS